MKEIHANVIVHLRRAPDGARIAELRSALARLAGVVRAQPSERLPSMMLADYDPRRIDALAILASVRGRGIEAQLVGM